MKSLKRSLVWILIVKSSLLMLPHPLIVQFIPALCWISDDGRQRGWTREPKMIPILWFARFSFGLIRNKAMSCLTSLILKSSCKIISSIKNSSSSSESLIYLWIKKNGIHYLTNHLLQWFLNWLPICRGRRLVEQILLLELQFCFGRTCNEQRLTQDFR